jgi:hypothetical protein
MDLTAIVAAAAKTRLEGAVLRLVQQQGIDSLAPLVDALDRLPPWRRWWRSANRLPPRLGLRTRTISPCMPPSAPSQPLRLHPATGPLVQVSMYSPSALRSTPFDQLDITAEIHNNQASLLSHDDG